MPNNPAMSWIPSRREWQKVYRGVRYRISVRQLSCEPTKKGSQAAADDWWQAKLREIHQQQLHRRDYEDFIATNQKMAHWHQEHGEREAASERLAEAERLTGILNSKGDPPPPTFFSDPLRTGNELTPHLWRDRFRQMAERSPQEPNRTIAHQVTQWLQVKLAEARDGQIKPKRYDRYRAQINHFQSWVGGAGCIDAVDAAALQAYRLALLDLVSQREEWESGSQKEQKKGISRWEGKQRLQTAVQWVRWLWRLGLIELPRILDDPRFGISVRDKTPRHIPVEHAKLLLGTHDQASEQTRLYVLLAANCGMRQADIASIEPDMVDWNEGRIRRQRIKTVRYKGAPMVDYKLWNCTFDLLKKYGHRDGNRVLLNRNGSFLWREELRNEKLVETDNIQNAYRHRYLEHFDLFYPFGLFRATSANVLESHPQFKYFASYFLSHSPQGVKDKHYTVPDQAEFDAAVVWIGLQYGLA